MTDEQEWIDNISKLQNQFSQILYLILYLEENDYINYEEKIFLKKLLLTNPESLISLLNELKETKDIILFYESVMDLIPENNMNYDDIYNKKHLITISSNSWNDEITKDDNINNTKSK